MCRCTYKGTRRLQKLTVRGVAKALSVASLAGQILTVSIRAVSPDSRKVVGYIGEGYFRQEGGTREDYSGGFRPLHKSVRVILRLKLASLG